MGGTLTFSQIEVTSKSSLGMFIGSVFSAMSVCFVYVCLFHAQLSIIGACGVRCKVTAISSVFDNYYWFWIKQNPQQEP